MKFFELLSFIYENITRQRGRVLLTSLGVVIGSASIILLVALVGGLQQTATAQFASNRDLTRIDVNAGHGMGKPTAKLIAETADIQAFIVKAVG